jgi:hypothetical protein
MNILKLKVILCSHFHNSGHYEFFAEVDALVEKYPAVLTLLGPAYTDFKAAFAVEDAAFHISRRSDLTELLAEADRRIDSCLIGLVNVVEGLTHHFFALKGFRSGLNF